MRHWQLSGAHFFIFSFENIKRFWWFYLRWNKVPYFGHTVIMHSLPRSTISIFFSLKIITTSKCENLFRPIFETQIHFQIHVRYFKPLPIATYYLITIYVKSLHLHSKTYDMDLKWNLYLTSLSRRGPVNPSTQTFGNINLTETMTNLIVAWKFNQKRLEEFLFAH